MHNSFTSEVLALNSTKPALKTKTATYLWQNYSTSAFWFIMSNEVFCNKLGILQSIL